MPDQQKSVVITGASTGIGLETARLLCKSGFRVFGSVRREEDGRRVAAELGPAFSPLVFDVTDEKAVKLAAVKVRSALNGQTLAGLVNNAGIAVAGPLVYLPLEDFRRQLDVNLTGVLIATQCFAPLLGIDRALKGKPGRIVNISSVSGRQAQPFMGPYAASKFGLEGMSEALRQEMAVFGIDVVVVAPGAVATPIWDKAEAIDTARYATTAYAGPVEFVRDYGVRSGRAGLPPKRLAQTIREALTVRNPGTRYEVRRASLSSFFLGLMSRRSVERITANAIGLKRIRR